MIGGTEVLVPQPAEGVWQSVAAPANFVTTNWPLVGAALSTDHRFLAVAGVRGLAIAELATATGTKWRLFNDVTQEQALQCVALAWCADNKAIAAVTRTPAGSDYTVRTLCLFGYAHFVIDYPVSVLSAGQNGCACDGDVALPSCCC